MDSNVSPVAEDPSRIASVVRFIALALAVSVALFACLLFYIFDQEPATEWARASQWLPA